MECPLCNGDLIEDCEVDTSITEVEICINNFVCLVCNSHFEIEYTPIDIREI